MELNFNSVKTIPVLNASAAFKTDSGKVFISDYDMGDGGHVFRTCQAAAHPARRSHRKVAFSLCPKPCTP